MIIDFSHAQNCNLNSNSNLLSSLSSVPAAPSKFQFQDQVNGNGKCNELKDRHIDGINLSSDLFVDNTPTRRKVAPDPLKNIDDINKIINYFTLTGQYRNLLLFTMGINFGLRCKDLLKLKVGNILDNNCYIRKEVFVQEQKNKHYRTCYMNDSVMDAAEIYLTALSKGKTKINLNDFLFTSLSHNNTTNYYQTHSYKDDGAQIEVSSVEKMLKKTINEKLNIDINAGTHLMRKTFSYHLIMSAPDRTRAIEFLQKVHGHSSQSVTLYYAGITEDEIKSTCQNLNLGKLDFWYASGLKIVG